MLMRVRIRIRSDALTIGVPLFPLRDHRGSQQTIGIAPRMPAVRFLLLRLSFHRMGTVLEDG